MDQIMAIGFPDAVRQKDEICLASSSVSVYLKGNEAPNFVNITTPPKSGTHLLIKALKLLGVSYKTKSTELKIAPHICQYANFLPYDFLSPDKLREVFDLKEKYIVTIRDPKDFLISYIQWVNKKMDNGEIAEEEAWREASMNQKLDQLLWGGDRMQFQSLQDAPWNIANYLVAERLMALALPNILFLRFEDLVGPDMGGSSREKQVEALTKLCEFCDVKVTAKKIDSLIKLLPGGTLTYISQKKVGKWKEYFSEENIAYYNFRLGKLEKGLGYASCNEEELKAS